uniref:Pancreatic trypsin inhibitor n=1 Tax=Rhipicephalus zambeziensis TaxID=60191 RepID=A0A224Y1Y4_9ACAR
MYYFDSRTHLCNPTCSNAAPFQSRGECVGICRSVLVCFAQRAQNVCNGSRSITVYFYNPRKGRCIAGKSCTYIGNNFPTLDECRRTCGAFTGLEEPGEEDSSKVLPEISTKPTKEEPKGPGTEHNKSSTTPAPTLSPNGAPLQSGAVPTPQPNESSTELPPSSIPVPKPPSTAKPSEKDIVPTIPHRDSRCLIFLPDSTQSYCKSRRYYFDIRRHLCMPTCSKWAPFQSSSECTGLCRGVLACFLERRNVPCKTRDNFTVFYYDLYSGLCIRGVGCSYSGNNFPTKEECQHTCISSVHEAPHVDSGIAPSPMTSQQHPTQNQLYASMVRPSPPDTPEQQPATPPQVNPTIVPPVQSYFNGPQLSLPTESPVQDQATRKQSSVPNSIVPIPKTPPPMAVLPIPQRIKQQELNANVYFSIMEPPMQQVNTEVPAKPLPSTFQKNRNISPAGSQHQEQSLQGPIAPPNLPPAPQSITQQASSRETQIVQKNKQLPLQPQVISETLPQTTEQRLSTNVVSTKQWLLVQQQSPKPPQRK